MIGPTAFWVVITFLYGLCIGSFLNVVIYRLAVGRPLNKPEWSFCPNCEHRLNALDLIPLVSFLALGRRCRYCKNPISWRYFWVELLTAALFVATYLRFQQSPADSVALILFSAVLIPIFFIDLATYTIPNSLNLMAFVLAVGRDVWGIAQHEPGHALLWGWLPRSLLGALVGVLIFGLVRVIGWLWKRVEAMGLGDVFLARGMGAMLVSLSPSSPLRLFPVWVMLSCFSGLVVGIGMIVARNRTKDTQQNATADSESTEEEEEESSSLREQLLDIVACLVIWDAVEYMVMLVQTLRGHPPAPENPEDWQVDPAPTAIPFGPFMVLGFLLTVFGGEWLTAWYLATMFPKP